MLGRSHSAKSSPVRARRPCARLRATATALLLATLGVAAPVAAQDTRQDLARSLARTMLDEPARRQLNEQVAAAMLRSIGLGLQERLSRPLLESEWRMIADIVRRFVADALPPSQAEEITARVYARHFDEAELRELLRFQQSDVGRKAARLAPAINEDTAWVLDAELRASPAIGPLLDRLQRAFPVLRPESP
jgi:hypothetical protein